MGPRKLATLPMMPAAPSSIVSMARYIGLREKRYRPPVTSFVALSGDMGLTVVRALRKAVTDAASIEMPKSRNNQPTAFNMGTRRVRLGRRSAAAQQTTPQITQSITGGIRTIMSLAPTC